MKMLRLLCVFAVAAGCSLLLLVEPAAAQDAPTGGAPPIPNLSRSPHAAIGYAVMFVLLVAVIAVSIMPSKRGHQD